MTKSNQQVADAPKSRFRSGVQLTTKLGVVLGMAGAAHGLAAPPASADAATCTGAGGVLDLDCTSIWGDNMWISNSQVRMWRWGSLAGRPAPRQICQYNAHFFGITSDAQQWSRWGQHHNGCSWSPAWVDSGAINRNFKVNTYFCGEASENHTPSQRYVCWMMQN